MKKQPNNKLTLLCTAAIGMALFLVGCGGQQTASMSHDDHDHDHPHDHAHGDHDHDHDHAHGEGGHTHEKKTPGPNGGRLITLVEPHAEFFVTEDRKVRITFVDDENKVIEPAEQIVKVIAGERTNPTILTLGKEGHGLVSEGTLPEGDGYPLVLEIKRHADADPIMAKFNLDMSSCPSCDYKEYACICGH